MPLRLAALCGLLAPVAFVLGVFLGDLAQPDAFSPADDSISDLGALTATKPWLYNQVAANLTGLLILGLAAGLWVALGRSALARLGVVALAVLGAGIFRRAVSPRLPGDRRRVRERLVALHGAPCGRGLHQSSDARRACRPRLRVQASPGVAADLASEPPRDSGGNPRGHPLQRPRHRRVHARDERRAGALGGLARLLAAPDR